MNKNVIIDGVVNSGKTRNVIFPMVEEIISKKESFIVSDLKREYYNYFSSKAKENGYDVCVINIDNPLDSDSINLFDLPYKYYLDGKKDESYRIINEFVKNIYANDGNSDPFWGMSASSLVLSILAKIMEDGTFEELNFKSVYNFLTKFSNLDTSLLNSYFKVSGDDIIFQGATSILSMPPETKESVVAVAKQMLFDNLIYNDTLNMINKSSFKIDVNKPVAMFVITSNNYNKNVFFNMILSEMEYIFKDKKLNVILDNFDCLDIYNFKLKFSSNTHKINYIVGTRDIDSLIKNYSNYLFKVSEVMYINGDKIKKVFDSNEEILDIIKNKIYIDDIDLPKNNLDTIKTFNIYEHLSSDLLEKFSKDSSEL